MEVISFWFGVGAASCLLVASFSDDADRPDAMLLAVVLCAQWLVCNVPYFTAGTEEGVYRLNGLVDGLTLLLCFGMWGAYPNGWRVPFLAIVVAQLGVDAYRETIRPPFAPWAAFLNALYGAMLLIVASPGASNGYSFCHRFLHRNGRSHR